MSEPNCGEISGAATFLRGAGGRTMTTIQTLERVANWKMGQECVYVPNRSRSFCSHSCCDGKCSWISERRKFFFHYFLARGEPKAALKERKELTAAAAVELRRRSDCPKLGAVIVLPPLRIDGAGTGRHTWGRTTVEGVTGGHSIPSSWFRFEVG